MQRECVIVGAGIMGASIALRMAQAGRRPTLLERSVVGAEASSAAAGILSPQAEARGLAPIWPLAIASLQAYEKLASDLLETVGLDIGYRKCNVFELARDGEEQRLLDDRARELALLSASADRLSGGDLRALEPELAPDIVGGLRFSDQAQVDPRALSRALSAAVRRAGVEVVSGQVVERVCVDESGVSGVKCDGLEIESRVIVIAAGSWSGLIPGVSQAAGLKAIRPARGQLAMLDPRVPPLRSIVFGAGGYLVPRADGRVLAGATTEFVGFDKQVTACGLAAILNRAMTLVPTLAGATVESHWAGLRPFSPSGRPLIGATEIDGLYLATGHFRNGILLAPVTAEIVTDQVLGRPARFGYDADGGSVLSGRLA